MIYREILPHVSLRNIVECYWSLRGNSTGFHTVYPDSCMDIIYDFGTPGVSIVGTMFSPILSHSVGFTDMFGIRFHAGGMSRLLSMPLSEFNDASCSLNETHKAAPQAELLEPLSIQDRVNMLDRWLLKHIVFSTSKPEAWEHCLNTIVARSGNINVYDLSREVGISQKQMERKFIEKVGPTPKQFAQLLKFRRLREYLSAKKDESLMNVAFEFGFTDHAHLTKFFKKFATITPNTFLTDRADQ